MIDQAGLGLGDRDMYLADTTGYPEIRSAYVAHLGKLLTRAHDLDPMNTLSGFSGIVINKSDRPVSEGLIFPKFTSQSFSRMAGSVNKRPLGIDERLPGRPHASHHSHAGWEHDQQQGINQGDR